MTHQKQVWGLWLAALGLAVLGATLMALNGGLSRRAVYLLVFVFAVSGIPLLALGRKVK